MSDQREAAWARIQEQAFTMWMDRTLQGAGFPGVKDLRTDIQDGVQLVHFLELLADRRCSRKLILGSSSRIQRIGNINAALTFLRGDMGVQGVTCSAENILDVTLNEILGMLWVLFRKYRMAIAAEGTKGEDAILEWVNSIVKDYGIEVKSFRTGFQNGLAYLALAHAYDPDNCPFKFEAEKGKAPLEILNTAFDHAQKAMDIQRLLKAEEVVDGTLDERAMSLYTSLFYHAYKAREAAREAAKAHGETETLSARMQLEQQSKSELVSMNLKLREELDACQRERGDLMLQISGLQDEVKRLRNETEAAQSLTEEERQRRLKLEAQLAAQAAELAELRQRLKIEEESKKGNEREMSAKLAEQTLQLQRLEEAKNKLVEAGAAADAKIKDLQRKMRRKDQQIEGLEDDLKVAKEQSDLNRKGLAVLRSNLERHIGDLHTWQKYLDGGASTVSAPDPLIAAGVDADEFLKQPFIEQLNKVSGLLDDENVAMTRLLTQKLEDQAADGAKDKKKKDRK
eukprot:m51a1_g14350 putative cortexillin (513) ;mRNA; r:185566-188055